MPAMRRPSVLISEWGGSGMRIFLHSFPVLLPPAVRADIQAHPANSYPPSLFKTFKIPVAGRRIKPGLPRLIRLKNPAGKRRDGACADAFLALPAAGRHGCAGRFKRGVGQHCDPADAGAAVRCDKKAALPDPAETCKMRRELVGDRAGNLLLAGPFRRRDRECPVAFPLDRVCNLQRNQVEGLVDHVITVMPVQDGSGVILPVREEIDLRV